jgi:hypothetical protein
MMHEHATAAASVYSTGRYADMLVFRWHELPRAVRRARLDLL